MTWRDKYPLIGAFIVAAHMWWVYLLITVPDQVEQITGIHLMALWFGATGAAVLLTAVTGLAVVSVFFDRKGSTWGLLALLPQEGTLLMSAMSSVEAMHDGMYPDGYVASWQFISSDQISHIILAILHTVALTLIYKPRFHGRRG